MFLNTRFYTVGALVVFALCAGHFLPPLFVVAKVLLALFALLTVADAVLLYLRRGISAERTCSARFSNGDENPVRISVSNAYPFAVSLNIIDEIPVVFQNRNVNFALALPKGQQKMLTYTLRPVLRGGYGFGLIRVFASTPLGLVARRYSCGAPEYIKVYPSYLMLHRYELLAMSNNLTEFGIKKVRRVGHHTEFEQIKEYVQGDDYRTINWKATARRNALMVNIYQDERSQQIFSLIDKGRMMQQAFRGMTLLDYAINASLVLSYVAIHKDDKAGLATFNERFDTFVPASKQSNQMQTILESLYNQATTFGETDYSALCVHLNKHLQKRSFLMLYTNFASMDGLTRQLPYLKQLATRHRLLVVFFEDAELKTYIKHPPHDTEGYYRRVIAEKFEFEKRLIVNTLKQHGIYSLLTTPENLSIDVINKYLEMKSRQLL